MTRKVNWVLDAEHRYEAERFLDALRTRFAQFGLELHLAFPWQFGKAALLEELQDRDDEQPTRRE